MELKEEEVGLDSSPLLHSDSDSEFEFISGPLVQGGGGALLTAAELFEGGIIRPLKPHLYTQPKNPEPTPTPADQIASSSSRRCRVSELAHHHHHQSSNNNSLSTTSSLKQRFKNFFLLRSFSEGRANAKLLASLKKYSVSSAFLSCIATDSGTGSNYDTNSSFRSTIEDRKSLSRRRSSPDLHRYYRSISDLDKRKTSLPYKHGLLGCMGIAPPLPPSSGRSPGLSHCFS